MIRNRKRSRNKAKVKRRSRKRSRSRSRSRILRRKKLCDWSDLIGGVYDDPPGGLPPAHPLPTHHHLGTSYTNITRSNKKVFQSVLTPNHANQP